jgi:hypothetical protein
MATTLGAKTVGDIITIMESNVSQPFYVAQHNYQGSGRTLLVRRYVYEPSQQWNSTNVNTYATSTIDTWLNGTYLALFAADIQAQITAVNILYTPMGGTTTVSSLSRRVFLLSLRELMSSSAVGYGDNTEGTTLTIASTLYRATTSTGVAQRWWTRSPMTYASTTEVWTMLATGTSSGDNNDIAFANATYYARPAFTLPTTVLIGDDGAIITSVPYIPYGLKPI